MKTLKLKNYLPYLIFFGIAAIAFFQVSFYLHPGKYDLIDCFYPWRFYIGECLQNGQLPYWNPYQDLGYPIHADPSSGAWYPMVWLIGYFNGYTIYSIGFELWFHVFLGGVGFYTLAKTLKINQSFALLAGIAFMLSGVFTGNAQHLSYIISACWLPYVLNFYFRLAEEKSHVNSLKAAFFLFLMITGGYPAFTIILFYLLLIFFFIYFKKTYQTKTTKELIEFISRHVLFLVYTILLSLVLFVAIYQVSPYLSRLGDFSLEQALFSPFSPQSFVSFILPLVSTTHTDFFNSDLSMRNGYFGLFIFLFFLIGLFSKKPMQINVLFYFGLFSLAAAVGEYLPVREFLFKYVPMMNVFRFPSVFRLFFIIAGILTGVYYLQDLFNRKAWTKKSLSIGAIILAGFFLILLIVARMKGHLSLLEFIKNNLFIASEGSTFWQNVAFQSIVQLLFLGVFLFVLWKFSDRKKIIIAIILLTITDLVIATQLNAPYTVYYETVTSKEASDNVSRYPKGFPKLQDISIEEAGHLPLIGTPFWQNMNTFQKQVSAEGFNSFSFTNYEFLESEYPQLFSEVKKNKLLLLSDSILPESKLKEYKKDSLFAQNQIFLNEIDYTYLIQRAFEVSIKDTAFVKEYDAAHFNISTSLGNRRLLTLHQKYYKGWKATVNGKKARIFKSNLNFMTIMVPRGKNVVLFEYKNPVLKSTFFISASCFIFAILLFLFVWLKAIFKKA
ncbi:MAG: hypothetical protein RI883_564 [Bacteroidota bacterium]